MLIFFRTFAYFFRTFAYFFGELAVFSKKIELAPSEKIPVGNPQALFSDLRLIPEGELAPPIFLLRRRMRFSPKIRMLSSSPRDFRRELGEKNTSLRIPSGNRSRRSLVSLYFFFYEEAEPIPSLLVNNS